MSEQTASLSPLRCFGCGREKRVNCQLDPVVGLPEFDEARSASATIKGYLFQFDATMLAILDCTDNSPIRVEGVEDFDVVANGWTQCVQCKYYEGTELSKQVLREVVVPMLRRLKDVGSADRSRWGFSLYGHFKNKPPHAVMNLTEEEIFDALQTYKVVKGMPRQAVNIAEEEGFDKELIAAFARTFKIHFVSDFEEHRSQVISRLRATLDASESAVREIHYPAALYYVANVAARPVATNRISTRPEFLLAARPTPAAVNSLLLHAFGQQRYCSAMRKRHFSAFNREPVHYVFLINYQPGGAVEDLVSALKIIANKYSRIRSKRTPENEKLVPVVVLVGMPEGMVLEVKKILFSRNIFFNDGFGFYGSEFDPKVALGSSTSSGCSNFALLHSVGQLDAVRALGNPMTPIYQFSSNAGESVEVSGNVVEIPVGSFNWMQNII